MAIKPFHHLIVKRLSAEAMRNGVICPAGLSDVELIKLSADCSAMMDAISIWVTAEIERRDELRKECDRKVVPLPGCGMPHHYWE